MCHLQQRHLVDAGRREGKYNCPSRRIALVRSAHTAYSRISNARLGIQGIDGTMARFSGIEPKKDSAGALSGCAPIGAHPGRTSGPRSSHYRSGFDCL